MFPRRLPLIACLALLALLCLGCGQSQRESAGPAAAVTLKRGNGGEPGSLDPSLAEDIHAYSVLLDLFEGLVTHGANGELQPGAAEKWTVSPDGLEYRFFLREGARWSNGDRLLAKHFVDGIRHVVRPGTLAPNAFLFERVLHYQEVLRGDRPASDLGVRAEGENTVVFTLGNPAAYFPGILAMPVAFPRLVSVHGNSRSFRDPEQFVSNGAYLLDEWRIGSHIRLRRNNAYRLHDQVAIEFVEYFPIEDPMQEYHRYRTGELDMTATIPPAVFAAVAGERPLEVHASPGLAVYYLAYDLSEPPLSSLELRKALSLAIDRGKLVDALGRGEIPAYSLVPPGVSGHRSAEYSWRDYSPDRREQAARDAYGAAGYSTGAPLSIKLTYDAGDVHEKIALIVSSMWTEVLGANVSLEKLEWKIFLDTRTDRSAWQVMRFAWFGDYDDASTFLDIFRSASSQNLSAYRNNRFEEVARLADELNVAAQRQQALFEAERTMLDDYPIIPLYFYVNKHRVSTAVKGYTPNVLDRHPTQWLSLQ